MDGMEPWNLVSISLKYIFRPVKWGAKICGRVENSIGVERDGVAPIPQSAEKENTEEEKRERKVEK